MTASDPMSDCPGLSIVVPAFNEGGSLGRLHDELLAALGPLDLTWELIFVDDGSTDNTWREIQALNRADPRVRGIRLSRNFGHQGALLAGMSHARGEAVVSMDADLQHPPNVVPQLVAKWRHGSRIVKTVRRDPAHLPFFKRKFSSIFYRVFAYLSGVDLRAGMADFRLLDRRVLDQLLGFKEGGLFLRGMVEWVGYPSAIIEFDCGTRFSGSTKYDLSRMLRLAWHGISSFSLVPLRIAISIGLAASGIAFLGVVYAIASKWLEGHAVAGWTSTVAIMSFLFGVLFLFLAVLAEYVGRILEEVRARPRFIVSEQVGEHASATSSGFVVDARRAAHRDA